MGNQAGKWKNQRLKRLHICLTLNCMGIVTARLSESLAKTVIYGQTLVDTTRIVRNPTLPLQDRSGDNSVKNDYLWGLNYGGGIGGLLNLRQNGQGYDYLYDGSGNVHALLDVNTQIVASYRHDTFGKPATKTGTLSQPFQFSTKRYDAGVGLNYYGYRFYAPALGRWMNRDPLGKAGGVNLYGFVLNNPVNWVDPWGLLVLIFQGGGGIGTGGNEGNTPNYGSGSGGFYFGSSNRGGSQAGAMGTWEGGNILGGALGYGPSFGPYFGDAEEMSGESVGGTITTPWVLVVILTRVEILGLGVV